jgi:hypothetical protein
MSAQRKRVLTIHSKERNITANVIKCCDEEPEQKYLSVTITKATARAAEYCNARPISRTVARRHELTRASMPVRFGDDGEPGPNQCPPTLKRVSNCAADSGKIYNFISESVHHFLFTYGEASLQLRIDVWNPVQEPSSRCEGMSNKLANRVCISVRDEHTPWAASSHSDRI